MEEPTTSLSLYVSPNRTNNFISPCIGKSKSSLKSQGTFTVPWKPILASCSSSLKLHSLWYLNFQIHHNQRLQRTHYLFDIQNDSYLNPTKGIKYCLVLFISTKFYPKLGVQRYKIITNLITLFIFFYLVLFISYLNGFWLISAYWF
jgi:hypothetical protein